MRQQSLMYFKNYHRSARVGLARIRTRIRARAKPLTQVLGNYKARNRMSRAIGRYTCSPSFAQHLKR